MTARAPKPRLFHPTPSWLIIGLLAVEGLLWLSERFQWPTWHKGYAVLIAVAAVGVLFLLMLLWFIVALLFRLRFQFSIWSLLVLTVAVALPCSWLGVEMKKRGSSGKRWRPLGSWPEKYSTIMNAMFRGIILQILDCQQQLCCEIC